MKGTNGTVKKMSLSGKFVIRLLTLFIVLWALISLSVTLFYRNNMEEKYTRTAFAQARIAAMAVDGDRIKAYETTLEKDEYYYEVQNRLKDQKSVSGLKYLYIVVPREEEYFYIWDAGDPDSEEGVCDLGDADTYYGGGDQVMKAAFHGDTGGSMLITRSPSYGYVASAFYPVYDSAGEPVGLASVDISMDEIISDILRFLLVNSLVMILILVISCILYYRAISGSIIAPVQKLEEMVRLFVTNQMEKGDVLVPDIHTGDEIEVLADSFSRMSVELKTYIHNFEAVTKEKERISTELNVATQIQADMLPSIFPPFPFRKEFDLYASMTPAKEVGGDFYDFFMVDDDHIALTIADVSGKGVPAALFMVIAKTLIKNRTQMKGSTPSEIFADVNNQLCEGNEAGLFVTVWLCIVEISTGHCMIANAGHEHPVVKRKSGKFELIEYKHSPAIAVMDDMVFRQHDFQLEPGDTIFVYTDGVAEATNSSNELFGTERMLATLNAAQDADVAEIIHNMKAGIDAFVKDAPQFDDITMLAFHYKGSAGENGEKGSTGQTEES